MLAAALGAFTVIQIQLAHFFAVDPISTTFTVAAVYHAIRMVDTRGWTQTILTGVMAALAIASKFSAAPILAAPAVAGLIITWRQQHEEQQGSNKGEVPGLLLAAAALVVAGVVFVITSPFVILDFENFNQAVIKEQGAMVRGVADFPFTRQYRGTIPYLYFIEELVKWGMGWPLGILGWLAFGWAIVKVVLRRAMAGELIVLSWLVPYFLITGGFLAKFSRYMVPVAPFLSLLAAGMLWTFAGWWVRRRSEVGGQKSEVGGQGSEVGVLPAESATLFDEAHPEATQETENQRPTINNQQSTVNEAVISVDMGTEEPRSEIGDQRSDEIDSTELPSTGTTNAPNVGEKHSTFNSEQSAGNEFVVYADVETEEQDTEDGDRESEDGADNLPATVSNQQPIELHESPIPNTQYPQSTSTPTHHAPRTTTAQDLRHSLRHRPHPHHPLGPGLCQRRLRH